MVGACALQRTRVKGTMAFLELTRILPENKKVKWSVNPSNIIYVHEPLERRVEQLTISPAGS
jgi:hypothetical protein